MHERPLPTRESRYNLGHTRMKTAISIPDDVFERAERAAKRMGLSRSELFTRAVREFLSARDRAAVKASYDEAFADGDEKAIARFRRRAVRKALLDVEWSEK